MATIPVSRWNHNMGLFDPKYSLVLKNNEVSKLILSKLNIKSEGDDLIFPFFSLFDPKHIIGAYRARQLRERNIKV